MIPDPIPAEGYAVPVRAAFTSIKRFPILAVAHNNAAPKLVLFEDRVLTRVVGSSEQPLSSIEQISIVQTIGTQNLVISPKGGFLGFSANVGNEALLAEVVQWFQRKGVPLSEKALRLLTKTTAPARET